MELCQRQMSVRLASLRSIMGKECLQILRNLRLTAEQQATVKGCLDGLEAHFKPQRNVVYERYVSNSCVQSVEESVDVYVNRLRKLASSCELGALTDELIRDRLVIWVKDRDLKGRLLRQKGLSLQKAIEMCKSNDITKQQLKSLENEEKKPHEEVNMCKQSGRRSSRTTIKPPAQDLKKKTPDFKNKPEKGNSKRKCKYCGKQMHNKRQDCPAFGSTCHKCKKSNHFASVCNSKRRDQVNTVEDENDSDSDLSVLTVDVVSAIASKGKQVLAKLTFCIQDKYKTSMECQLDTGASCNVISHRDLSILLQNGSPPLNHSSVKLKLLDGSVMRTREKHT